MSRMSVFVTKHSQTARMLVTLLTVAIAMTMRSGGDPWFP